MRPLVVVVGEKGLRDLSYPLLVCLDDALVSTPAHRCGDTVRHRHSFEVDVGGTRGACFPGTTRVDAAARGNPGLIHPPPSVGSRSKVICRGRPYLRKKVITVSSAGGFVEILSGLGPESNRSASIDKIADFDHPAFACLADSVRARRSRHPCASIWISSNGARSSVG